MDGDEERRINEIRYVDGIEKAEHVQFPDRDEFWVRFTQSMNLRRLTRVANGYHYEVVKFGGLPSFLPSRLGELLWDGVSYVILRRIGFRGLFASLLGSEPDGVAKVVKDLHSSQDIFITSNEEGVKILYAYLGLNYSTPTPPQRPVGGIRPVVRTPSTPVRSTASPQGPLPPKTA